MNKTYLFVVATFLTLIVVGVVAFGFKKETLNTNKIPNVEPTNEAITKETNSSLKVYSGIIASFAPDASKLSLTSGGLQLSFESSVDISVLGPDGGATRLTDLVPGLSVDVSAVDKKISSIKIKDLPYIVIDSPAPQASVDLSSKIKGAAKYGDGYLYYKIINRRTQAIYGNGKLKLAKNQGNYSTFSLSLGLSSAVDILDKDFVDVNFYDNQKQEIAKNKIVVPYLYNGGLASKVKIYIGNGKGECGVTSPVERLISAARSPIRSSIEEIIKGPSDSEQNLGRFSPISSLTEIRSLDLSGSTLYLDFTDKILDNLKTPCDIATARAEITQTVRQFSSIKTIVITVNNSSKNPLSQ